MPIDNRNPPPGPQGTPEFDELQRGEEQPITLETLEQAPPAYGEGMQVPIPDPGERPGAVRIAPEPVATAPHPPEEDGE